jgi:hypothetical protein
MEATTKEGAAVRQPRKCTTSDTAKRTTSPEAKAKIAAGMKASWAARKAKEPAAPPLPVPESNAKDPQPSEDAMASVASIEASSIAKEANPESPAESNPVTKFKLWLEQASAKDLEEAEPEFEKKALSCYRTGHSWRLEIGECFYKHREVVKKARNPRLDQVGNRDDRHGPEYSL